MYENRYNIGTMSGKISNGMKEWYSSLLETLEARFEKNMQRHIWLTWNLIEEKLRKDTTKLKVVGEMEKTGGDPDVVWYDEKTDEYLFVDCSPETPIGRRSFCYDTEALESRKKAKPADSATGLAEKMGVELLTKAQYLELQKIGDFDTRTSSWLRTPDSIRDLGGAIFWDRRYGNVFIYHNGAESYYSTRGFRGMVRV